MSAPVIYIFSLNEIPKVEDLNSIFDTLASKFGQLDGTDFIYPLQMAGDINLNGNRLLRAREVFGVLNLEEYGTSENAFEQAINELSNGGLIIIPRNTTITVSRSIKIRGNRNRVYIMGSGHSSQIKLADGADDAIISIDGSSKFRISNLYLNGNRANNTVGHGLHIKNCEDFELSNLWIGDGSTTGTPQSSIMIEGSTSFSLKRSWIRNPEGPGLHIDNGCQQFNVSEVYIRDTADDGTAVGQRGYGILVRSSEEGVIRSNTLIAPAHDGISVQNCKNVRLQANQMKGVNNPDRSGISVSGENDGNQSEGIYVVGNIVSEFGRGITVGSWVTGGIFSNQVRNNTSPLKYDGAGQSKVTFQNNMAMDRPNHGKVTMTAGTSAVNLDIGVTGLPIQGIQATWNYAGRVTHLKNSVLAAVYAMNGLRTVTFYSSEAIGANADLWYSIFV